MFCTHTAVAYGTIPESGSKGDVHWRLVDNFNITENSYEMHWRPGHGRHPHMNESTAGTCKEPYDLARNGPSGSGSGRTHPIRIVVLAPLNSTEEYSLLKIMPSILAAVRSIRTEASRTNGKLYRGWEKGAVIDFVDTKCSSAIGPMIAFDYFIRGKVDVFLGPVCPYVLAPVARYTSFWDVPHLTSSGQVTLFDEKNSTFRILTRMNGSFSRMGQFFHQVSFNFGASKTIKLNKVLFFVRRTFFSYEL